MGNTGGSELIAQLSGYGVETIFGMPGVHTLAFFAPLAASGIRHVGARHEQGAAFMADGFARATGRPGVCLLISGPGVTNAATPIGQAYSDSIPLLAVTSAIARRDMGLGRGMLHEITNQQATTAPITGFSAMALTGGQIGDHVARAMTLFQSERPRPVHISIPLDVLDEEVQHKAPKRWLPSRPGPNPADVMEAVKMLQDAKRPLILAGGGCRHAGNSITKLAEFLGAPVVTTVAGKGIVPESHPLSLGSTLQRARIRHLLENDADLVLAIGTEISEPDLYVTADAEAAATEGSVATDPTRLAVTGRFIRVDIDPQNCVRDYSPDVAIVSDAMLAAEAIIAEFHRQGGVRPATWSRGWETLRQEVREDVSALERQHILVLDAIRAALPINALIYADMTQIAYTGCVYFPVDLPGTWHFPVGYGTLGYALPAAVGGAIGCPERACAALVGDGGFLFTIQELGTAVEEKVPLPIILWDNDGLGEIADFMRARAIPEVSVRPRNPDFEALAKSFGCQVTRPTTLEGVTNAVKNALSADGPTVIIVRQDAEFLR